MWNVLPCSLLFVLCYSASERGSAEWQRGQGRTFHIQAIMRWSCFMPFHHFFIKRREERERAFYFYENGSLLLAKLIASCNAKPIPIRTFSAQQLFQATNNFSSEKLVIGLSIWYKGSLEGWIVLIKCSFVRNAKPIPIRTFSPQQLRQATNNYPAEHLEIYWYKGSLEGRIVLIKR